MKKSEGLQLHQRISGVRGDSAVVALVSRHHDVSIQSPSGTPAVLHHPVVLSLIIAVASHQHGVLVMPVRTVIYSSLVATEAGSINDNCHTDGSHGCHGLLERCFAAFRNLN